mmetsp:Transcript_31387/g.88033  ORF Transcript_31387/g.88033 Transcript_31387/m.88033 type:complete len:610 (+) Transcript_31387:1112-2941(+)
MRAQPQEVVPRRGVEDVVLGVVPAIPRRRGPVFPNARLDVRFADEDCVLRRRRRVADAPAVGHDLALDPHDVHHLPVARDAHGVVAGEGHPPQQDVRRVQDDLVRAGVRHHERLSRPQHSRAEVEERGFRPRGASIVDLPQAHILQGDRAVARVVQLQRLVPGLTLYVLGEEEVAVGRRGEAPPVLEQDADRAAARELPRVHRGRGWGVEPLVKGNDPSVKQRGAPREGGGAEQRVAQLASAVRSGRAGGVHEAHGASFTHAVERRARHVRVEAARHEDVPPRAWAPNRLRVGSLRDRGGGPRAQGAEGDLGGVGHEHGACGSAGSHGELGARALRRPHRVEEGVLGHVCAGLELVREHARQEGELEDGGGVPHKSQHVKVLRQRRGGTRPIVRRPRAGRAADGAPRPHAEPAARQARKAGCAGSATVGRPGGGRRGGAQEERHGAMVTHHAAGHVSRREHELVELQHVRGAGGRPQGQNTRIPYVVVQGHVPDRGAVRRVLQRRAVTGGLQVAPRPVMGRHVEVSHQHRRRARHARLGRRHHVRERPQLRPAGRQGVAKHHVDGTDDQVPHGGRRGPQVRAEGLPLKGGRFTVGVQPALHDTKGSSPV